ncbi:DNA gyrase/topoisomerase IV subunit A [Flammeovirgaceae bacterium SG7u.111]|nr:DNA gyrase/topoisomerase IV subunit A [Flammeovirgaceae bacterium SG7u.132]WPO37769.1 DNA gyrase/topoisomerase IV subunit A [Flammeovirgaceae bacterium SG7u.111]
MENNNEHAEEHIDGKVIPISGMYENWFLDYASYVILERAVPAINDGFKPVQRRILHAMKELDDGRFNKVANIIGTAMQYHPHGDASIGDAIVNMGQKDMLIDMQGNWGDIRTGDRAAAPRYIEARLSKFALDVVYNPQTTEWQASYDGRKKEPVTLPVKFPMLLAQGAEGIAVGLATKIMPHNFCELIEASIKILQGKSFNLVPDFPTGGLADFSNYNEGLKGGKIRIRAKIEPSDNKTLLIKEIPYSTTTQSLIDSIIKANDQGKIKIKKVVDNTAKDVEIEVHLAPGQSPDITIDALYAFTDCESSISPNCCVVIGDKPRFMSVNDILRFNTQQTADLLKSELEIRKGELQEKILFSSLEKIFIENRIYRDIEECETWESVIETIDQGLDPYKKDFYREINDDDIIRLTEIKIKRISKFDSFKADEMMRKLEEELAEVNFNLDNLTDYAIDYYKNLLKKYGKGKERKTDITAFDTIAATKVAANNAKLYVNRKEGFIGYGLKKDEYVSECSDIDDIIVFFEDGKFVVTKIQDKVFVGKGIIHVEVFIKGDERKVFNLIYRDGKSGTTRVKRFQVLAITRDKPYDLTIGTKGTKVLYFTANPNGEAEVVSVNLTATCKARTKQFDYDFATLDIKGRASQGNILTKYPIRKVSLLKQGVSTLSAMDLWYDSAIGRLNKDDNGQYLGKFNNGDQIIAIYQNGEYEITDYELSNRYDQKQLVRIEKFEPEKPISVIHYDGKNKDYYVKRFVVETTSINQRYSFIGESSGSKLTLATTQLKPMVEVQAKNAKRELVKTEVALDEFIDLKGWKAMGNKLSYDKVQKVKLLTKYEELTPEQLKSKNNGNDDDSSAPKDDKDQLKLF